MTQMKYILLVDDSEITNRVHTIMFRKAGYDVEVATAGDGLEALQLLRDGLERGQPRPDVLLLDLNMPRMNGFEFLDAYEDVPEAVRARIVIVMVTSSLLPRDRERAERSPYVQAFKTKPLDISNVHEINALFEQRLS